jgi:hypothetical protein
MASKSAFTFERIDENTHRLSGYTMPIKDLLKRYGATYEPSSRTWLVPDSEKPRLNSDIKMFELRQKVEKGNKWTKACNSCGLDFVTKGTPEYFKVLECYKSL